MTALKISTLLLFSFHPFALNTSALTHCLYPSAITASKGFLRAGSIYGFICSLVLGGKGWLLILTNSALTLLARRQHYFFYILLGFIFLLFLFFWANMERIFLKKQYSFPIALLSFTFIPPISFPTPIKGCIAKI